jgi:hypothetical protein
VTDTPSPEGSLTEIPRKWLTAAAGFVPILLQAITYICYKEFFSAFQIRPEEAGYDFASLLGQQAAALLAASALVLAALAALTATISYYPRLLAAILSPKKIPNWVKSLLPFTENLEGVGVDLQVIFIGSLISIAWSISETTQVGDILFLPATVGIFSVDHILTKKVVGSDGDSAWVKITKPRQYSALRVLVVSFVVVISITQVDHAGPLTRKLSEAVASMVIIFVIDRAFPVIHVPTPSEK